MAGLQRWDFWDELSINARAFAYNALSRTAIISGQDPEDFAQEALLAARRFAQGEANARRDLFVIDEIFRANVKSYLFACPKNRFVGACRQERRRQRLMPTSPMDPLDGDKAAMQHPDPQITHEQRMIAASMMQAVEARAKTDAERRFVGKLRSLDMDFDRDRDISPTAVRASAGISPENARRLAVRIKRAGILAPRDLADRKSPMQSREGGGTSHHDHEKDLDDETT